jgi:hypothetical protein
MNAKVIGTRTGRALDSLGLLVYVPSHGWQKIAGSFLQMGQVSVEITEVDKERIHKKGIDRQSQLSVYQFNCLLHVPTSSGNEICTCRKTI